MLEVTTPSTPSPSSSPYAEWKGWDRFGSVTKASAQRFAAELARAGVRPRSRILEIGFGSGEFLAWCRDSGHAVCGVDTDQTFVDRAKDAGFNAFTSVATAYESFDGNDCLDAFVAFDVIEHMEPGEVRALLASLSEFLKPGAKLILQFPNGSSPFVGHYFNGDLTHRTLFTRGSLEQLLIGTRMSLTGWHRPLAPAGGGSAGRAIDQGRRAAFASLRALSRTLYGADVDWWPVAVAVLSFNHAVAP